jgi:hypothetical protein
MAQILFRTALGTRSRLSPLSIEEPSDDRLGCPKTAGALFPELDESVHRESWLCILTSDPRRKREKSDGALFVEEDETSERIEVEGLVSFREDE